MVDFCNLTGYLYNADGTPLSNATFTLYKEDWSGITNGSISPVSVDFTTSALGFVDIDVTPGAYTLVYEFLPEASVSVTIPNTATAGIQTIL